MRVTKDFSNAQGTYGCCVIDAWKHTGSSNTNVIACCVPTRWRQQQHQTSSAKLSRSIRRSSSLYTTLQSTFRA